MEITGVALLAIAAINVVVIAAGWANARTQPRAKDRPDRAGHGPLPHAVFAMFAVLIVVVVTRSVLAA